MNLIQAIEARDAGLIHGNLLNLPDELPIGSSRVCRGSHSVENRAYLVLTKKSLAIGRDFVSTFLYYKL